jgi:hypothetical protein
MKKEHAKQLIALLRAIDIDQPKDFIDSVCAARDALTQEAEDELAVEAFGCEINPFSSRCCEAGTKSCITVHNDKLTGDPIGESKRSEE